MIKGTLAREIIEEYTVDGYCILSKKKLGEVLFERHPTVFKNNENARLVVRRVTGAQGETKRRQLKTIAVYKLSIPEPEENDYSKFIVTQKKIGILSDIHLPYYNKSALEAAINHLLIFNPDCIILNGDIIDCYQCSDFVKDPRQRDLAYEFDMLRSWIADMVKTFPKARIVYKLGNHEERYERQILQRLPAFVNLKWFDFETAVNWEQPFRLEIVKNKRIIKAGHLNIVHGHEFAKGFVPSVNPARGNYLKAKSNVLAGHNHRTSEHIEQDINGKMIGSWSMGCLSELHPAFMPNNSWNHGFATVEVEGDEFQVKNLKIVKGKIL